MTEFKMSRRDVEVTLKIVKLIEEELKITPELNLYFISGHCERILKEKKSKCRVITDDN